MPPPLRLLWSSLATRLALAAALTATLVFALGTPWHASATAINPRGVQVIAGIHDTAINDCDNGGTLQTAPSASDLAAATASFDSQFWPAGVGTARVTVPWDIADPGIITSWGTTTRSPSDVAADQAALTSTRDCLNVWLKAAFAHHLQPEIDFRQDNFYCETKPGATAPCTNPTVANDPFGTYAADTQVLMPSLAQYTDAVFQFRNQYIDCGSSCAVGAPVINIAPWNEPNNKNYNDLFPDNQTHLAGDSCPANPTPDNCGAVMAAQMWSVTYELVVQGGVGGTPCTNCVIVAGNFTGDGGVDASSMITGGACPNGCPYIYLYNQNLKNWTYGNQFRPVAWAMHPYGDIKAYQDGADQDPSTFTTTLNRFASRLQTYGYGTNTSIWLNEVSTCAQAAPSTCDNGTLARSQNDAMNYLLGSAPTDLTMSVPAGGPQVGLIDYYCFQTGNACSSDWALIVNGQPTAAYQTYAGWANG